MAKLADAHGSGPCVSRHASSSLAICTKNEVTVEKLRLFYLYTNRTSSSDRTKKTHGSADDFSQSQLLFLEQSLLGNQLQLTY